MAISLPHFPYVVVALVQAGSPLRALCIGCALWIFVEFNFMWLLVYYLPLFLLIQYAQQPDMNMDKDCNPVDIKRLQASAQYVDEAGGSMHAQKPVRNVDETGNPVDINQLQGGVRYVDEYVDENGNLGKQPVQYVEMLIQHAQQPVRKLDEAGNPVGINEVQGYNQSYTWAYGDDPEAGHLRGKARTLDSGVETLDLNCHDKGSPTMENSEQHCAWGLVSRSGRAVIDDTGAPVQRERGGDEAAPRTSSSSRRSSQDRGPR